MNSRHSILSDEQDAKYAERVVRSLVHKSVLVIDLTLDWSAKAPNEIAGNKKAAAEYTLH